MRASIAGAIVVAIPLMSVALFAQLVQPVPGPGSGIVTVAGNVNVANTPSVHAAQAGDWKVTLANTPPVALTPPEFLRPQGHYDVIWSSGLREMVTVVQIGKGGWGGWVKVQTANGRVRWINVAAATSVEELP